MAFLPEMLFILINLLKRFCILPSLNSSHFWYCIYRQYITLFYLYFHKIVEAQVLIKTSSKRQISLLYTCFGKTHAIFSTNDNRLFTSDIYMSPDKHEVFILSLLELSTKFHCSLIHAICSDHVFHCFLCQSCWC